MALIDFDLEYDARELALTDDDPVEDWPSSGEWVELPGSGRTTTISAPSAAEEPTYRAARTPTGAPAVEFDGGDRLRTLGLSADEQAQPNVVMVVVRNLADPISSSRTIHDSDGSGTTRNRLRLDSNGEYAMWSGSTGVEGGSDDADWHVITCIFDGASSSLRIDGTQVASGSPGGNTHRPVTVGSQNAGGNYWLGDIAYVGFVASLPSMGDIEDTEAALTAAFVAAAGPPWSLTVNVVGEGSVAKDPDQAEYDDEDPVDLTATPDPGWEADDPLWTGADVPGGQGNANPLALVMDSDKTVTANFVEESAPPPEVTHDVRIRSVRASGTLA